MVYRKVNYYVERFDDTNKVFEEEMTIYWERIDAAHGILATKQELKDILLL